MIKFGDFQFDRDACSLTQNGLPVALEPQALQLLGFLIKHRDGIVSKDDLIEEIWEGRAITDAALTPAFAQSDGHWVTAHRRRRLSRRFQSGGSNSSRI